MKRNEAIEYFQKKIENEPTNASAYHNLAVLLREGDTKAYRDLSRIALLALPGSASLHSEMGLALLHDKETVLAREHFRAAIRIDGNYAPGHINLSAALAQQGQYKLALSHIEVALSLDPDNAMVHRNAAKILQELGRTRDSMNHNIRALEIQGGDAAVCHTLALQNISKGSREKGIEHYTAYRTFTGKKYNLKL